MGKLDTLVNQTRSMKGAIFMTNEILCFGTMQITHTVSKTKTLEGRSNSLVTVTHATWQRRTSSNLNILRGANEWTMAPACPAIMSGGVCAEGEGGSPEGSRLDFGQPAWRVPHTRRGLAALRKKRCMIVPALSFLPVYFLFLTKIMLVFSRKVFFFLTFTLY